jgi:biopolymer transport protein ExbD
MRFLVRKRRATPTVIIVALIDVLVVLLIFLMVTTTFRQQPVLKLTLPESSQSKKAGAEEHPPLVVNIDEKGVYHYGTKGETVTSEQLRDKLVADVDKTRKAGEEVRLAVRADKNAPWSKIIFVLDLARELNIKNLSAFTKEAGKT